MQHENELLNERDATHGDIRMNSAMYDELSTVFWKYASPRMLAQKARFSFVLDMIFTKLVRLCTGDPMFEDHWVDLSGYSSLGKTMVTQP